MGGSSSKNKTGPLYVPDPHRPSHLFVLRSPEVLLATVAMAASFFLLLTGTHNDKLNGYNGLWETFNRKSRVRMQSREAEALPDPPTPISADMALVVVCTLACNAFLNACARVLVNEQLRLEKEEETAFLKATENPETRAEALAKKANALAERIKIWEENDQRRAAGRTLKRERIVQVDVMADDALTSIIVVASVILTGLTGWFIQMQPPNAIRGCGAGAMLAVLVGGMVVCGADRNLTGLRHYCNYVNLICVACFMVLFARATLLAN
ncbi:hypothetical protein ABB37_08428 [Leptomonas pyrrhocoris]|uniref:Uncharacterized protein n=1 Tax=Leptomonas pyrrhocoris TaxID=157538 RepID=A0A0N0DS39_LEPPY|nr:hypothetical protein ABB37_08428 [Leptomonas pyrrhocoris]KPA75538.1 hypothetical protein ABB37_08428 [Leptomonas pyrrhocoris]|eukprot:XP_015653977.1 hypothetical protein ABB37_08428 [Leptomonas pyrrhocoris]